MNDDLTALESHFGFGENWRSYLETVNEEKILEAEKGLLKLLDKQDISGSSFLDLGCGSGIHLLAAARLGASRIVGIDIDPDSIGAARTLFSRAAPEIAPELHVRSALAVTPESDGMFDIVYSWGVLHHTGSMWKALDRAANLVPRGGLLAVALYQRTRLCGAWRVEKRYYSRAPAVAQRLIRNAYVGLLRLGYRLKGLDFAQYVGSYQSQRGMDFWHDVHDWLGGYPYESVTTAEMKSYAHKKGFEIIRQFDFDNAGSRVGMFGTACAEFVLRRSPSSVRKAEG